MWVCEVLGPAQNDKYLWRWSTRWTAIEGAAKYFNKITEELIDPAQLCAAAELFLQAIGHAYQAYVDMLFATNRIDFAHQQKLFFQLLDNPTVGPAITSRVRYVMVDEYQDTNYVQEQLLLRLAGTEGNLCVVGDEDQAMYRFRGATVRNILEFHRHFPHGRTVTLSVNYRSHAQIIAAYNIFLASSDWNNPTNGPRFRYNKTITPDPEATFPEYPAVFAIWGENRQDEARHVADLVAFLKEHRIVEDESQVAILLHSVRLDYSEPYLQVLASRGIQAFCPRARAYFDNDEVRFAVGCFAVLLDYYGAGRGQLSG
jgi:DNA helicase-2/ATP-dependent DNA helicase PcrA